MPKFVNNVHVSGLCIQSKQTPTRPCPYRIRITWIKAHFTRFDSTMYHVTGCLPRSQWCSQRCGHPPPTPLFSLPYPSTLTNPLYFACCSTPCPFPLVLRLPTACCLLRHLFRSDCVPQFRRNNPSRSFPPLTVLTSFLTAVYLC